MIVFRAGILVAFAFAVVRADSSEEVIKCDDGECVKLHLCIDGTLSTDGTNLIDIRFNPDDPCEHYLLKCCKIPDIYKSSEEDAQVDVGSSPTDNELTNSSGRPSGGVGGQTTVKPGQPDGTPGVGGQPTVKPGQPDGKHGDVGGQPTVKPGQPDGTPGGVGGQPTVKPGQPDGTPGVGGQPTVKPGQPDGTHDTGKGNQPGTPSGSKELTPPAPETGDLIGTSTGQPGVDDIEFPGPSAHGNKTGPEKHQNYELASTVKPPNALEPGEGDRVSPIGPDVPPIVDGNQNKTIPKETGPVHPGPGEGVTVNPFLTDGQKGCGFRNKDGVGFRITGDNDGESEYGEFPWMVAILKEEKTLDRIINVYQCGGSLIHPKVVLTAAHCVYNKQPKEMRIRLGEWDTQTTNEMFDHQDRNVVEMVFHDKFNHGNLFNDVALLFLDKPAEIIDTVNTVCLPPQNFNFDLQRCFASGWGKDVFGKEGRYQVILKKIELPVMPHAQCQKALRTTRLEKRFILNKSFLCAGGEAGKDTCKGDGGSPLVCPIPGSPHRFYQAGIVAWGIGCGENGIPGVYAKVAGFRNWIDEHLTQRNIPHNYYLY